MTPTPRPRPSAAPHDSGPADAGHRLSAQECWARLRHHRQGRLSYTSGRGPRHVVLPYAVVDDRVVVRVPAFSEAAGQAAGRSVTFAVVEQVAPGTTERVEVHGRARTGRPEGPVLEALPDEHWPADLPSRLVWLHVDDVHGETASVGCGTFGPHA